LSALFGEMGFVLPPFRHFSPTLSFSGRCMVVTSSGESLRGFPCPMEPNTLLIPPYIFFSMIARVPVRPFNAHFTPLFLSLIFGLPRPEISLSTVCQPLYQRRGFRRLVFFFFASSFKGYVSSDFRVLSFAPPLRSLANLFSAQLRRCVVPEISF